MGISFLESQELEKKIEKGSASLVQVSESITVVFLDKSVFLIFGDEDELFYFEIIDLKWDDMGNLTDNIISAGDQRILIGKKGKEVKAEFLLKIG